MPHNARRRGAVFAIGGREERRGSRGSLPVLERFVTLCGGPAARLVVVTTASDDPEDKVELYDSAFRTLGVEHISFFHPAEREATADPRLLSKVARADGVFFTGGNQLKLVAAVAGTPLHERLRERHERGLHLAGTSAGAAAMSTVMIAGGKGGVSPRFTSVRMAPGLGFISEVIVDQHFRERDRYGRLFTAVLYNPSLLGFGLDEDTAFLLDSDGEVSVVGTGTLTVVDGGELHSSAVGTVPAGEPYAFAGMRLHVLSEGWTYSLAERRVTSPGPRETAGDARSQPTVSRSG